MVPLLALALALALALSVGACGSSDSSDDGGEAAPTKAQYVARANAICRRERAGLERDMAAYLAQHRADGEPREELNAELAHRVLLQMIESQMWQVERLPEPPEDKKRISAMFAAERIALDSIAVRDRVRSIGAVEQRFAASGEKLRDYGLADCANGP